MLTQALRQQLPPLCATENEPDPLVVCKFFMPDGKCAWYAIEYDGDDRFFGLVDCYGAELGYFHLSELKAVRGYLNLPVRRDRAFKPVRLSQVDG